LERVRAAIPPTHFTGITRSGGQVQLQWEGSYPSYRLEALDAFGEGDWAPVEPAPIEGTSVELPEAGSARFFRLEGVDP
jgi:hypothetical protein